MRVKRPPKKAGIHPVKVERRPAMPAGKSRFLQDSTQASSTRCDRCQLTFREKNRTVRRRTRTAPCSASAAWAEAGQAPCRPVVSDSSLGRGLRPSPVCPTTSTLVYRFKSHQNRSKLFRKSLKNSSTKLSCALNVVYQKLLSKSQTRKSLEFVVLVVVVKN